MLHFEIENVIDNFKKLRKIAELDINNSALCV